MTPETLPIMCPGSTVPMNSRWATVCWRTKAGQTDEKVLCGKEPVSDFGVCSSHRREMRRW